MFPEKSAELAAIVRGLPGTISNWITNEIKGVNRVCCDISSRPPSAVEWE